MPKPHEHGLHGLLFQRGSAGSYAGSVLCMVRVGGSLRLGMRAAVAGCVYIFFPAAGSVDAREPARRIIVRYRQDRKLNRPRVAAPALLYSVYPLQSPGEPRRHDRRHRHSAGRGGLESFALPARERARLPAYAAAETPDGAGTGRLWRTHRACGSGVFQFQFPVSSDPNTRTQKSETGDSPRIDEVVVTYFAKPHSYTTMTLWRSPPTALQSCPSLRRVVRHRWSAPRRTPASSAARLPQRPHRSHPSRSGTRSDRFTNALPAKVAAQQLEAPFRSALQPIKQKLSS